ncbi:rCG61501 [Rattus norvegicus]|uniref:RCG61501 n=1 Tax=Rattus norvegicus TaxID=10116 RepID=A6HBQ7_RAT|nr:rCG61501 [Rattus norvegicus]
MTYTLEMSYKPIDEVKSLLGYHLSLIQQHKAVSSTQETSSLRPCTTKTLTRKSPGKIPWLTFESP